ncbi:DUF2834 domain-containing protein [Empedobacter brevis]|uniref:DUF2834 domain-containing protein n=1 Tax=Empedobacter brevis TaxID=247 RepID=UPI00123C7E38|nr:DUF2834 domain-containing protein [Empedobacter brevis]
MKLKHIYLLLMIIGSLVPLFYLVKFVMNNGPDIELLIQQLFVNDISTFFGLDVIISALVTIVFILFESKRLNMKSGIYSLFGMLIGVSFCLPLFLYLREVHRSKKL